MCTGAETLLGAGVLFSAASQITGGRNAEKAGRYNAAQLMQDAQDEREASVLRAMKTRREGKRVRGQARADLAASGVSVDSGTPLDIDEEIAFTSEEDAAQQLLFGEKRARGMEVEARGLRMAGANAARQGGINALGSVLAGGAELYGGGWRSRVRGRGVEIDT
jgi:hypothetical protein